MALPQNGNTPGAFTNIAEAFSSANGTTARVIQDMTPPSGTLAGGCRVFDLVASSTDTAARAVNLYTGVVLTSQSASATGQISVSAQNTITRSAGSFIADGWRVGQALMVAAPIGVSANASDGAFGVVTAVAATMLQVNGTPFSNETFGAGSRLIKVAFRQQVAVGSNAGTLNTNASLLGSGNDSSKDPSGIELGANGVLIAAMATVVSVLPAQVFIDGHVALR